MGMRTYIEGIKPPDGRWKKMKAVWDACTASGVDIPDEVMDFFEGEAVLAKKAEQERLLRSMEP